MKCKVRNRLVCLFFTETMNVDRNKKLPKEEWTQIREEKEKKNFAITFFFIASD